jgi:general secretion pathway protein D
VTLAQLGHLSINNWSTSLPGAILNFMMTDSRTNVVDSPQLRASDGQKASLKIGERYPYATGSYLTSSTTASSLVSTQFNYADVGVNVEITPQVHSATELTLHVSVEVSNIASTVNVGGISQPVIGQNKNDAEIRMRSGEINIMGGLKQLSDSKNIAGLPGLTDIPILGSTVFGSTSTDKQNNQLIIALIPHILRTPDYSDANMAEIYAGSDQQVKLRYAPIEPEQNNVAKPGTGLDRIDATLGGAFTIEVPVEKTDATIKWDSRYLRLEDIAPGDLIKDIRNDRGEAIVRAPGRPVISTLKFVSIGRGSSSVTFADKSVPVQVR